MKIKLSILLMLFAFSAVAGSGVGNGGYSVVCRDDKKVITSAELLDIFEGRVLSYYDYSNNPALTEKDFVDFALGNIRKVDGKFAAMVEAEIKLLETRSLFINQELVLEDTNDAFPAIGRRDCKFEQLANYTSDEKLLISSEIYNQLPILHKAALKVHEAVYYLARKTGHRTSQKARKVASWSLAVGIKADDKMTDLIASISKPLMGISIKAVCGQSGSLESRIIDCNTTFTTRSGHEWQLISKNFEILTESNEKVENLVYLTPSKRIVTKMNFDLNKFKNKPSYNYNGAKIADFQKYTGDEGKKRAKKLMDLANSGKLCSSDNFDAYPESLIHNLSIEFKLANLDEVKKLFNQEEAEQIFNFNKTQNLAYDKTFGDQCDFEAFFSYYWHQPIFDNMRYYDGRVCQLPVFNARTQLVSSQPVKADTLEVICIE